MNINFNKPNSIFDIESFKHRINRVLPYFGKAEGDQWIYIGTTKHWRYKERIQFAVTAPLSELAKSKESVTEWYKRLKPKNLSGCPPLVIYHANGLEFRLKEKDLDAVNLLDELDDFEDQLDQPVDEITPLNTIRAELDYLALDKAFNEKERLLSAAHFSRKLKDIKFVFPLYPKDAQKLIHQIQCEILELLDQPSFDKQSFENKMKVLNKTLCTYDYKTQLHQIIETLKTTTRGNFKKLNDALQITDFNQAVLVMKAKESWDDFNKDEAAHTAKKIQFELASYIADLEKYHDIFIYLKKIGEIEEDIEHLFKKPLTVIEAKERLEELEDKLEFDLSMPMAHLQISLKNRSSKTLNLITQVQKKDLLSFYHILVREASKL